MSRSVYTLTADTDAAAAARMLLRHNLKSAPVVDGDQVVGIVGRRDLLRLIARSDHDIRADLERRLEDELAALQRLQVEVADGVVTIDAAARPLARQLLEALAWTVPGVVEVRAIQSAADGADPAEGDRR
jgi:CBS domain-containing protein